MLSKMSLNIQECQRNSIIQMLSLNDQKTSSSSCNVMEDGMLWKILIYDKPCQDLIGPLMKVWSLRQHGVTLHLSLNSERTPVHEAPAVYLVEPTLSNIQQILKDLQLGLYRRYFINFSTSVPQALLEKLAITSVQNNTSHLITRVVDRFLQFISLSPFEFCLDLKNAFQILHSTNDSEIENTLQKVVDGLLSVVITLGVIPVIRCPVNTSSPAHLIGKKLNETIKSLLSQRGGTRTSQLFGGALGLSSLERPALILVDREIDFSVMLRHTWTYQALVHDLFKLRRNRVTVPVSSSSGSQPSLQKRTYDLDSSDALWSEYGSRAFPEAAVAISDALNDYNSRMAQLSKKSDPAAVVNEDFSGGITQGLTSAINALPEMTEKKSLGGNNESLLLPVIPFRSIDLHTNIATAVVSEITARGLDKLFEAEDNFENASLTTSLQQVEKLLESGEKGTLLDKIRTLVCFYLMKRELSQQQLSKLRDVLQKQGASTKAIDCLQQIGSFKSLQQAQFTQIAGNTSTSTTNPTALWGSNWIDRSKGLLEGVRSLLPLKRTLPLTRLVESLLEMKPITNDQSVQSQYLYLDPKASVQLCIPDDATPRLKTPFRQSLVFVVGGGSFVEAHALKEMSSKGGGGKQVLYGSTDFVSPEEFLDELETLGAM